MEVDSRAISAWVGPPPDQNRPCPQGSPFDSCSGQVYDICLSYIQALEGGREETSFHREEAAQHARPEEPVLPEQLGAAIHLQRYPSGPCPVLASTQSPALSHPLITPLCIDFSDLAKCDAPHCIGDLPGLCSAALVQCKALQRADSAKLGQVLLQPLFPSAVLAPRGLLQSRSAGWIGCVMLCTPGLLRSAGASVRTAPSQCKQRRPFQRSLLTRLLDAVQRRTSRRGSARADGKSPLTAASSASRPPSAPRRIDEDQG